MSADLAADLTDALAPEGVPTEAPVGPDAHAHPWTIDGVTAADWAGRKARQARQAIAAAQTERDRIVATADAWLAKQTREHEATAEFFEAKLTDWLRRELENDPKGKKSRELPCGVTVRRTAGRPSLVVDDEAELVEWLQAEHPELVEFVAKWSKADVKKLTTSDGEALKGAHVETGPDTYRVEVTP